jgi:hypothetical protein
MEWQLPQKPALSVDVMANDDPRTIAAPTISARITLNLILWTCFFRLTIDAPVLVLSVVSAIIRVDFGELIKKLRDFVNFITGLHFNVKNFAIRQRQLQGKHQGSGESGHQNSLGTASMEQKPGRKRPGAFPKNPGSKNETIWD